MTVYIHTWHIHHQAVLRNIQTDGHNSSVQQFVSLSVSCFLRNTQRNLHRLHIRGQGLIAEGLRDWLPLSQGYLQVSDPVMRNKHLQLFSVFYLFNQTPTENNYGHVNHLLTSYQGVMPVLVLWPAVSEIYICKVVFNHQMTPIVVCNGAIDICRFNWTVLVCQTHLILDRLVEFSGLYYQSWAD